MIRKQAAETEDPAIWRDRAVPTGGRVDDKPESAGSRPGDGDLAHQGLGVLRRMAEPSAMPMPALSTGEQGKDLSVETLRGLAIILMVMGHVIGSKADGGLRVPDDSWYRYFYQALGPLRMPLFTVISGYVYACRPVVMERASVFLAGKARRLLLPLVSVSTVQYVFSALGPGASRPQELSGIWRIYLFSYDQFWFLQAITLVFLSVFAMELTGMLKNKWGWTACLGIGVVLYVSGPGVGFFSINGWGRLLVFFILGVGLRRFDALSRGRLLLGIGAAVLAVSMIYYQSALLGRITAEVWMPWLKLGCGLAGTFVLFRLRFTYKPLAWMGGFAFTIYLLHSFGVVASRLLGKQVLGLDQRAFLFGLCLALGLALPILGHLVLARYTLTRRVFLGLR